MYTDRRDPIKAKLICVVYVSVNPKKELFTEKMTIKTVTTKSFNDYVNYMEKYKGKKYFRGHANSSWIIEPSIIRKKPLPSLNDEQKIIADSCSKENYGLSSPRIPEPISTLFRLQHYEGGTRICDLTTNVFHALYFAIEDEKEDGADGKVFVIDESTAISGDGFEMNIFSRVLNGEHSFTALQSKDCDSTRLEDILTRNHIIRSNDMMFSNNRSLLQGGTGIVFGFGHKSGKLTLLGDTNVCDLIVEEIIIPSHIKNEIRTTLKNKGLIKDRLYNTAEEALFEDVSLCEIDFTVKKCRDKDNPYHYVEGWHQVSTPYFKKDALEAQIRSLYENLFCKYGDDTRIATFFFFDEDDRISANYICRGEWSKGEQYKIVWNKNYLLRRHHASNTEISKHDAIITATNLANDATLIHEKIREYTSIQNYDLDALLTLVSPLQEDISKILTKAGSIDTLDSEAQALIETVSAYIYDINAMVGDIMNKRSQQLIQRDLVQCEKSHQDYVAVANRIQ